MNYYDEHSNLTSAPLGSTVGMTQTEQARVRETTLNELGLALARIEQIQNGVTDLLNGRLAHAEEQLQGLSAKLDTLSVQLQRLSGCAFTQANAITLRELIERRIDKLGNDMFSTLATMKLRKNKHKRKHKKGKK